MYLLVIFFPLLGSLITGVFGRFLGRQGSIILTTSCLFLSFLISLLIFYLVFFFPLLGSLITGVFGRFLGRQGSIILTTSCLFLSFLISLLIFYEVGLSNSICIIKLEK